MLVLQTITSRFVTNFWSTQCLTPTASNVNKAYVINDQVPTEQPPPVTPPQPTRFPDEDDEILDNDVDATEQGALTEERKKFAKRCLSLMCIGRDVTQHILEYSTTYDLCSRVRGVNRDLRSIVSTSNGWFTRRLMPARGVPDCVQVVRILMHTYIYGKEIHERALRLKAWKRKPSDDVFFDCATRLWSYENGRQSYFGGFPTLHEVAMTWCHGLEELSRQLLALWLQRLGMDEKNLSASDRRNLRKMYLEYQEELRKDGLRMMDVLGKDREANEKHIDTYDWRWLDCRENDSSQTQGATYPICYVHPIIQESIAKQRIDPLVMMGSLRNREMCRRLCGLFVDLDGNDPVSEEDLKDIRSCLKSYVTDVVLLGQEGDIPIVKALMTSVRSQSQVAFSAAFVGRMCVQTMSQTTMREYLCQRIEIMNSYGCFDMDWDLRNTSAQQKLLFARALLPMCLSRIGEGAVRADPKFSKTLRGLEPKGDRDDALRKDLKHLFWSCF